MTHHLPLPPDAQAREDAGQRDWHRSRNAGLLLAGLLTAAWLLWFRNPWLLAVALIGGYLVGYLVVWCTLLKRRMNQDARSKVYAQKLPHGSQLVIEPNFDPRIYDTWSKLLLTNGLNPQDPRTHLHGRQVLVNNLFTLTYQLERELINTGTYMHACLEAMAAEVRTLATELRLGQAR